MNLRPLGYEPNELPLLYSAIGKDGIEPPSSAPGGPALPLSYFPLGNLLIRERYPTPRIALGSEKRKGATLTFTLILTLIQASNGRLTIFPSLAGMHMPEVDASGIEPPMPEGRVLQTRTTLPTVVTHP